MSRFDFATTIVFCLILARIGHGEDRPLRVAMPDSADSIPDVVFIPTPPDVVATMLELAAVQQRDVVYDLGCGDGRIVVAAAKQYGCRAVGFDIDPRRVEQSRQKVDVNRVRNLVSIENRDLFEVDLRPASVVTLYLSPQFNARLISHFHQLNPGSRIVSHQFEIRGVKSDKIVQVASKDDGRTHTVFLWITPLKVRD